MLVYMVGWPDVLIALIAGLPGIIGALYGAKIRSEIKTPSGGTLGKITEQAQQSAHANHLLLKAIDGDAIKANYIRDGIAEPDGTTPDASGEVGADEHD